MKSPWLFCVPKYLMLCLLLTCCKTFNVTPYECHYCNGIGQIICRSCNGTGTISCMACKGTGYVLLCHACWRGMETYKDGNVTKKRTCSKCKGNFSRICNFCRYGRSKCYRCNGFNSKKKCKICNGRGIDPSKIKEYERARTEYYQNRKK